MTTRRITIAVAVAALAVLTVQPGSAQARGRARRVALRQLRLGFAAHLVKAKFVEQPGRFRYAPHVGLKSSSGWTYYRRFTLPRTAVGKTIAEVAREIGRGAFGISVSPTGRTVRESGGRAMRVVSSKTAKVHELVFDPPVSYVLPAKVSYDPKTGKATVTEKYRPAELGGKVLTETRSVQLPKGLAPGIELYQHLRGNVWRHAALYVPRDGP